MVSYRKRAENVVLCYSLAFYKPYQPWCNFYPCVKVLINYFIFYSKSSMLSLLDINDSITFTETTASDFTYFSSIKFKKKCCMSKLLNTICIPDRWKVLKIINWPTKQNYNRISQQRITNRVFHAQKWSSFIIGMDEGKNYYIIENKLQRAFKICPELIW